MSEGTGYFIAGTDTDVGKTRVSILLMRQLAAAGIAVQGMKPVASGCERSDDGLTNADAVALREASAHPLDYADHNPYHFEPSIAPHLAAADLGVSISPQRILLAYQRLAITGPVIVEGVGGWKVPLAEGFSVSDLARLIGLPVILVVGVRLGCLNHARLTAESIRADQINIAGWVANRLEFDCERQDDLVETLKGCLDMPYLGAVEYQTVDEFEHSTGSFCVS
ncbi:MAG TPA: dethiobiotin synthase [Chromatiaceae bacterium]|jgi:dethiobiotin synthetase|nr:dethiobiotin synthase [Chromatiaceae bacterium]HIN82220.1 dethiobiotin synthase [Chromatiales bacterium]HIO54775.1 dethiobiotin synthase [Chromatiales bacterium]